MRNRILKPAVEHADKALAEHDGGPLASGLTPHSLRRTFASILVALGEDPAYVMAQMGHTDPSLTLRVYAQQMRRRDGERDRLRALVNGDERVPSGANAPNAARATITTTTPTAQETAR